MRFFQQILNLTVYHISVVIFLRLICWIDLNKQFYWAEFGKEVEYIITTDMGYFLYRKCVKLEYLVNNDWKYRKGNVSRV